jgi:hypothetical protein
MPEITEGAGFTPEARRSRNEIVLVVVLGVGSCASASRGGIGPF